VVDPRRLAYTNAAGTNIGFKITQELGLGLGLLLPSADHKFVVTGIRWPKTNEQCDVTFHSPEELITTIAAYRSSGHFVLSVTNCDDVGKIHLLTKLASAALSAFAKSRYFFEIMNRTEDPAECAFGIITKVGFAHFCGLVCTPTGSLLKLMGSSGGTLSKESNARAQKQAGATLNRMLDCMTCADISFWCTHQTLVSKRVRDVLTCLAGQIHVGQPIFWEQLEKRNYLAALTLYGLIPRSDSEPTSALTALGCKVPSAGLAVICAIAWRPDSTIPRDISKQLFFCIVAAVRECKDVNPLPYYKKSASLDLVYNYFLNPVNRVFLAAECDLLPYDDVRFMMKMFTTAFAFEIRDHTDASTEFLHAMLTFAAKRGFVRKYLDSQAVSHYAIIAAISFCPDALLGHIVESAAGITVNSPDDLKAIAQTNGGVLVQVLVQSAASVGLTFASTIAAVVGPTFHGSTPDWTPSGSVVLHNLKWLSYKVAGLFVVLPLTPTSHQVDCAIVLPGRFMKLVQLLVAERFMKCHYIKTMVSTGIAALLTAEGKNPHFQRESMGGIIALYSRLHGGCSEFAPKLFRTLFTSRDGWEFQRYTSPTGAVYSDAQLFHCLLGSPETMLDLAPPLETVTWLGFQCRAGGSSYTFAWNAVDAAAMTTAKCLLELGHTPLRQPVALFQSGRAIRMVRMTALRWHCLSLWGVRCTRGSTVLSWMCDDLVRLILLMYLRAENCPASMAAGILVRAQDMCKSFPSVSSARERAQEMGEDMM